LYASMTHWMDQ